ncbi:ABC transporter substrate-binding protein [Paracoccus sp. Z330]|uniref:ABC transporter substrate-binding protein n=1 Tax=Paracoccus onchidii TaxID=3017813 RepID=A0ABT4ZHY3_9RHOB|nr:ABC transporter substrate-binding protein [Paracoccus onchidii]MDB6178335.1 ABC transporter substrate-binding protein [Paracoccus onchidii]
MTSFKTFLGAVSGLALTFGAVSAQAEVLFWSTQAQPVEETQKMRDEVVAGFEPGVDYQAPETGPWLTRAQAELSAGSGAVGILGGLHGDLTAVRGGLSDLGDIDISAIPADLAAFGKLETDQQKYIPWMQATFLMVANKKALDYLPEGADLNALSYDQLIEWSRAMAEGEGSPKFGFPAGPKGLKHRFFQGFLLPSYSGSTVTEFRSAEAEEAWGKFRDLWQYTNPASTNYNFMQEQLVNDEVWLTFDHIARISEAFNSRPDDFVAFPVPSGPKGRGFMTVVAGMGVPETAPDKDEAKALIEYMLKPETQIATLRATNFYPVVAVDLPEDVPASVKASGPAIEAMTSAEDALPVLLPMGMGDLNGQFNQVYVDTFEQIVLAGRDIRPTLEQQAEALRALMNQAEAPCWLPDAPSQGACPVN